MVVIPGVVAFCTAFGAVYAKGRSEGADRERINGHIGDENVHCAPEHHERLIRIEEQTKTLFSSCDEIKEDLRTVAKRIDKALAVKRPAARRRS